VSEGDVGSEYHDARAKMIYAAGTMAGRASEVANRLSVHPSFVSMARRVVSVWGDIRVNGLGRYGLNRLYNGARLAQKIGRQKALELMTVKDGATLAALVSGGLDARKKFPAVDVGVYEQVMSVYERFASAYTFLNPGQEMSFDRFLETVVDVVGGISDELIRGIIKELWGDAYE